MPNKENFRYLLSFMSYASHDSGACLIELNILTGEYDYICSYEERLSRVKHNYYFPLRSIERCLQYFGLNELNEVDYLIMDFMVYQEQQETNPGYRKLEFDYIKRHLKIDRNKIKVYPHHLAHAYSAFIPSGFDEAAILVVDGFGSELETTSLYSGKNGKIELLNKSHCYGVGALYNLVTKDVLGFKDGEEGKTMGLAAFGEKFKDHPNILGLKEDFNGFNLDLSYIMSRLPEAKFTSDYIEKLKKIQIRSDLYDPFFSKVAYELQDFTEKVCIHLAKEAKKQTKMNKYCVAGGVGLNCVANEKVRNERIFDEMFVQPASSDSGVPFGLALCGLYDLAPRGLNLKSKRPFRPYSPISYSDKEVEDLLYEYEIPFKKVRLKEVAEFISQKKVVGWFNHGAEYGPRALGHRSILSDPRHKDMKEIMNEKIKHREPYRPFAPSVLADQGEKFFELNGFDANHMLYAPMVRPEVRGLIPAVVHVDGSSRTQTVSKEDCEDYYLLIEEFFKATQIPVVLNTSFNDNDEPIVETPLDALICFVRTNMDAVCFNANYFIERSTVKNLVNSSSKRNALE